MVKSAVSRSSVGLAAADKNLYKKDPENADGKGKLFDSCELKSFVEEEVARGHTHVDATFRAMARAVKEKGSKRGAHNAAAGMDGPAPLLEDFVFGADGSTSMNMARHEGENGKGGQGHWDAARKKLQAGRRAMVREK